MGSLWTGSAVAFISGERGSVLFTDGFRSRFTSARGVKGTSLVEFVAVGVVAAGVVVLRGGVGEAVLRGAGSVVFTGAGC
jgi:hypothetical protein